MMKLTNFIFLMVIMFQVGNVMGQGDSLDQNSTRYLYEGVIRNFIVCQTIKTFEQEDSTRSGIDLGNYDFILDSDEYYSLTFNVMDSVIEDGIVLISYSGFSRVFSRLPCSEIEENYGVPYLINASKPFINYRDLMDKGVVGLSKNKNTILYFSGELILNDFFSHIFRVKEDVSDINKIKKYIRIRYFNYEPTAIEKVSDYVYRFHSPVTKGDFNLTISWDKRCVTLGGI